MVERHGSRPGELERVLGEARYLDSVVTLMTPLPTGERSWQTYRANFLNPRRVEAGAAFWRERQGARARRNGLRRAAGDHRRDHRHRDRVRPEHRQLPRPRRARDPRVRLPAAGRVLPLRARAVPAARREARAEPRASAAPTPGRSASRSSCRARSGATRWTSTATAGSTCAEAPADAIGSVANFLAQHGWLAGAPIAAPAEVTERPLRGCRRRRRGPRAHRGRAARGGCRVRRFDRRRHAERADRARVARRPSEFLVGLQNFYVLTRYNRSSFYAAAVRELAAEVKAAYAPR